MAKSKQKPKMRNPYYDHPLMRKGGVHEKSNKARRKGLRQKLNQEWCSLLALTQCQLTTPFVKLEGTGQ